MNTAQDFGRSLMFLAPVVVLGALRLMSAPPVWLRKALVVSTACTLLLPAHHVMSDRVNPIYYLYHELAAFQNPPAAAMPEMFELRAIRAMQDGNFASAEADLTLAIKLASDPAPAAKQRGVLRASHGRWKDAGEDFALMARHEPKNPDAWFMRAQASLAVGDRAAAEKHFAHATELGGSDWSTRPDVARFRAKLAR
jgi:predicted Zn-dependent protease